MIYACFHNRQRQTELDQGNWRHTPGLGSTSAYRCRSEDVGGVAELDPPPLARPDIDVVDPYRHSAHHPQLVPWNTKEEAFIKFGRSHQTRNSNCRIIVLIAFLAQNVYQSSCRNANENVLVSDQSFLSGIFRQCYMENACSITISLSFMPKVWEIFYVTISSKRNEGNGTHGGVAAKLGATAPDNHSTCRKI